MIDQYLFTKNSLDLDMIIRTSGEIRLSDFLLWQSTHTLIYIVDVLWPEFNENQLYWTILKYQQDKTCT